MSTTDKVGKRVNLCTASNIYYVRVANNLGTSTRDEDLDDFQARCVGYVGGT